MTRSTSTLLCALLALCVCGSLRADQTPEAKTFMASRGASLAADALDKSLAEPWKVAKGKWEVADGAIRVSEIPAEMHGAAARRPLPTRNFVMQVSFRFDGGKGISVSVNDAKGHCCRAAVAPKLLTVMKDSHDHNKDDKMARLDNQPLTLEPGTWHTLVLEALGPELVASIDGEHVTYGRHESIDIDKKDFGLAVTGDSASFKDLRVWEATPRPDWESTKATLHPNPEAPKSPSGKSAAAK